MEIKSSLDWHDVQGALQLELAGSGFNPDLLKMFRNISQMVTELSQAEVTARRTRVPHYLDEHLLKINKAIRHLEQFLLMAKLMK